MAADVMKRIGTKYMGGFDFAIQTFKNKEIKPKIYLIDMNTARYTGTAGAFMVMERFGIEDKYFIRKTMKIKKDVTFKGLMEENGGLVFDLDSKRGCYFHLFGPDNGYSVVTVLGKDEQDANDLYGKLKNVIGRDE